MATRVTLARVLARRCASKTPARDSRPRARAVVVRASASAADEVYRAMSSNQEVAVVAVVGTSLVRDAATRHRTAPTATAALGRSLMCSLLLGTFKGEDETTQLTFKGDVRAMDRERRRVRVVGERRRARGACVDRIRRRDARGRKNASGVCGFVLRCDASGMGLA